MHSAVLQSKDYIRFARKHTVDVIVVSGLSVAVERKDRRARTFKGERDGEKVELMSSWPSLTLEEMLDLSRGPATSFNKSGQIPFTGVIDPHTGEVLHDFRGQRQLKKLMAELKEVREALVEEHGEGVTRDELDALSRAIASARELAAEGEYGKALTTLLGAAERFQEWPAELRERVTRVRAEILGAASAALDEIEQQIETDPLGARRVLLRLQPRLRGTGLEERAAELRQRI